MARAHIVLDDELLAEVDRIAGARGRSAFIEEAVREQVDRLALMALMDVEGSLLDEDHHEWSSTEAAKAWVRSVRQG